MCPGSPVFLSYAVTAIHTRILGRAVAFVMEDFTGVACAWLGTISFRGSLYARQLARFARLWWMDVACCKGLPGRQIAPLAWVCFEETEGL